MQVGDFIKLKTDISSSFGRTPEGYVSTEVTEEIKKLEGKVVEITGIDIFTLDLFIKHEDKDYRIAPDWVDYSASQTPSEVK